MIIKKHVGKKISVICFVIVVLVIVSVQFPLITFSEAQASTEKIVFVTRGSNPVLSTALSLIDDVEIVEVSQQKQADRYQNVTLPNLYDVSLLILDDIANFSRALDSEIPAITQFLENRGSFFVFGGAYSFGEQGIQHTNLSSYLPVTVEDPVSIIQDSSLTPATEPPSVLAEGIDWLGIPQIAGYTHLNTGSNTQVHLKIKETNDPFFITNNDQKIAIIAASLGRSWGYNLGQWPNFNYLIYRWISAVMSRPFVSFPEWNHSPIPQFEFNVFILPVLGVLWLVSVLVVIFLRKLNRPIQTLREPIAEVDLESASAEKLWQIPGPHRLWSGASWQLYGSLLLLIPQTILYVILYQVVFSAELLGFNQILANLTGIAFSAFDTGTWASVLYFASKYSETDPVRSVKYAQFLVWFQFFTGLIQVTLFTLFAAFVAPYLPAYAIYSWLFFFTGLGQYPGFLSVYRYMLGATQQFHYQNALLILYNTILQPLCQLVFGLMGIVIGGANPEIGSLLGGAIGLAIGGIAVNWLLFILSIFFFRRINFCTLGSLLGVNFGVQIAKEMLKYGLQKFFANIFIPLRGFAYAIITIAVLPQSAYWIGLIYAAWNISMFVDASMNASSVLTPVAAQAYHLGKKKITSYYLELGRIWYGLLGWMGFWPVAILTSQLVVGYFGPGWETVIPIVIFHALLRLSSNFGTYGLALLDGIGKPSIGMIGAGIRFCFMVILWLVFISPLAAIQPLYGAIALIMGEVFAEIAYSGFLQIFVFRNVNEKFHLWEMIIAPGLAGFINLCLTIAPFVIFLELIGLWGSTVPIIPGVFTVGNLFFILFVALMTFILQPFVTYPLAAFFGTFDEYLVQFYEYAAKMSGVFAFWARPVAWGVRKGYELSPSFFRNRMTIQQSAEEAFKELEELQALVRHAD
ncbi:MAG: hypothetical protein ACFFC7_13135 [Candidatus Hermodarchaeota archaeon]